MLILLCVNTGSMILKGSEYQNIKAADVQGRYITNDDLSDFLEQLQGSAEITTLGNSVLEKPIISVVMGSGSKRILMWSQMHGNESTTTKAVFDLINYLLGQPGILAQCTLMIIPILNPDGAEAYTRANANTVDLNRDAQDLSQPESQILRTVFETFKPDFCFNLHDQRTIYNVGRKDRPATVSFLSPSVDKTRSVTDAREKAMQLIVAMNGSLQQVIPDQVGRYDDAFNPNCVGDTFQSLNCPTILFEAGHFQEDYNRERTRELIFQALINAVLVISNGSLQDFSMEDYFEIPENGKLFFDVLVKNLHYYDPKHAEESAVGILFEEVLESGEIRFLPRIEKIGSLNTCFGHLTYDCGVEEELSSLRNDSKINGLISDIQ